MNIMCILEPLDGDQQSPIQWVLESREFFADEISGVGTACLPHIIVEMYSMKCSVHFRTIG
jgi:hypothetical protein